jgi:hypothetical protein
MQVLGPYCLSRSVQHRPEPGLNFRDFDTHKFAQAGDLGLDLLAVRLSLLVNAIQFVG